MISWCKVWIIYRVDMLFDPVRKIPEGFERSKARPEEIEASCPLNPSIADGGHIKGLRLCKECPAGEQVIEA